MNREWVYESNVWDLVLLVAFVIAFFVVEFLVFDFLSVLGYAWSKLVESYNTCSVPRIDWFYLFIHGLAYGLTLALTLILYSLLRKVRKK